MFTNWGVAVCEACFELVYEGDGGWTAHERMVYHVPCYIRAKHLNKLPKKEVANATPQKAKKS